MTDEERELDFQLGDLQRENAALRRQLSAAMDETLHLRHTLQHIYAKTLLALEPEGGLDHDNNQCQ
jgi:hypothetical protein